MLRGPWLADCVDVETVPLTLGLSLASNTADMEEHTMAKDPVCGMDVNESQAKAKSQYNGQTYYFCSDGCKQKFDANPQQFARKTA